MGANFTVSGLAARVLQPYCAHHAAVGLAGLFISTRSFVDYGAVDSFGFARGVRGLWRC